jgi:broad specificity phosphatase PhoE
MRHPLLVLSLVLTLPQALAACTTPAPVAVATTAAAATFVVVRHAEKADDGSRDPPLSAEGEARALRLAAVLNGEPVVAAYATGYRRTQQTAAATAGAHGLAVTTYAADQPAPAFAARLRGAHARGTVLVVGHSNTAPQIAAALCRCTTTPLGDHDYGRVYRIRVGTDGRAALQEALLP